MRTKEWGVEVFSTGRGLLLDSWLGLYPVGLLIGYVVLLFALLYSSPVQYLA